MGIIISKFGDNKCSTCNGVGKCPSYVDSYDCYDCYGTGSNYSFKRVLYATKGRIEETYINHRLKKCIY
jgi:DnaJ-class molecular chaperone